MVFGGVLTSEIQMAEQGVFFYPDVQTVLPAQWMKARPIPAIRFIDYI